MTDPRRDPPPVMWRPSAKARHSSRLGRYLDWLAQAGGPAHSGYEDAWQWSVDDPDAFWRSVWDHFEIGPRPADQPALASPEMPGARWFPGATLNYAGAALAFPGHAPGDVAVVARSQTRGDASITAQELRDAVARCREGLRRLGVGPGDRVAAMLPNIPEAVIAMLATASLGAVWSSCAPEFGPRAVMDRFTQIGPTVLLVVDGYRYGDRDVDRAAEIAEVRAALPGLVHVVLVPYLRDEPGGRAAVPGSLLWTALLDGEGSGDILAVPFDHPLYILFSSGTTGLPKPIVHGHGGILLEHVKALALHTDLGPGDRFCWYTTTGWMMWNYLVSGLAVGAAIVLFDGSPTWPSLDTIWALAADAEATYLGLSAPLIMAMRTAQLEPRLAHALGQLRGIGSTGAPLPAAGFRWLADAVADDIPVGSLSGGTDLCTGFLGPSPLVPVWAGEISCRMLGARVEAFDGAGRPVVGSQGELVITRPMPSMPVALWGDADGSRLRETYFEPWPGVWRHGDWLTVTERGSCIVSGRSDATLNRAGVRLGTAEFYAVVEAVPGVADSLVVHLEDPEGGPGELLLFVVPAGGAPPIEQLAERIRGELRRALSPRHAPDAVHAISAIPRTLSGKKLEVPVKRILGGAPPETVASRDSLADPASLDAFVTLAARRHEAM